MSILKRNYGWLLLLFMVIAPLLAQNTCPAIVDEALTVIGDNCASLERNTACYGYHRVDSTFTAPRPPGFFSAPADRTDLLTLSTIQTYPLDMATGDFGVAVINVQANVPESLPGQGVIFLLLGDTTVTNTVTPETAAQPVPAIAVTTASETVLYSQPSLTASAQSSVAAGSPLQADGVNTTAEWVRVIDNQQIAWVQKAAITPSAELDTLPPVGPTSKTPMQAFYFTTGIGEPACHEAEATIAIQSPENITVELSVNGVDIQVGSLVTLTGHTLTVHRGGVTTSTGETIPVNQTLEFEMDDFGNILGGGQLRPITNDEFSRGVRLQQGINRVAEANEWDIQTVTLPGETPAETAEPPAETVEPPPTGPVIYIVQRNDSLFSIARRFNTSVADIIAANGIRNPCILTPGQRLIIPNPGSGFVGVSGVDCALPTAPPLIVPVIPNVLPPPPNNCADFRILSGGETELSTFRWTAVPGADQYKINFYGSDGRFVTSIFVPGSTTSTDINMGGIGTGPSFQWEVEALQNGVTVCTTGRTAAMRKPASPPVPPAPPPAFGARHTCLSLTIADVSWFNAQPNDTISIFVKDSNSSFDQTLTASGASGTVTASTGGSGIIYIIVSTSTGASATLGGC